MTKKMLIIALLAAAAIGAGAKNSALQQIRSLADQLEATTDQPANEAYTLTLTIDSLISAATSAQQRKLEREGFLKRLAKLRKQICQLALTEAQEANTAASYAAFLTTYTKAPSSMRKTAQQALDRINSPVVRTDTQVVFVQKDLTGLEWEIAHQKAVSTDDISGLVQFRREYGYEGHEEQLDSDNSVIDAYRKLKSGRLCRHEFILTVAPYKMAYNVLLEEITPMLRQQYYKRALRQVEQYERMFGSDRSYQELMQLISLMTICDCDASDQ